MTGKEVKAGNLLPVVADKAHFVFSKIVEDNCVKLKGTASLRELETDGVIDEDSAVSIVLQEVGILKKDRVISHTKPLGRESVKEKRKLADMINGTDNLIQDTYAVVLTEGINFRNLQNEYKAAGMVYIYDDDMAISAGDNKIYSLGMSFFSRIFGGYFTKNLFSNGRLFIDPILAIIVPLDKIEEKKEVEEVKEEKVEPLTKEEVKEAIEEVKEEIEEKKEDKVQVINFFNDKEDTVISKEEADNITAEKKEEVTKASKTATKKKSVTTIANEVIAGKWGAGEERKSKLTKAGYDYDKVQKKVNEILSKKKSVDVLAQEVIDGKWGTTKTRKEKLTKAGYDYDAVQKKVNELLKCNWTKFEKSLKDTALDLKKRGVKYLGRGSDAGKIKDVTNCAGYVQEALYNIGCFPKGESFYLSKDVHGTRKAVDYIKENFKVLHSKKVWDKAALKPGDICGFDWGDGVHTMVYAGTVEKNGEKYPVWYTFGSATPFSDKPVRRKSYEKRTVYVKLRHKDMLV